MLVRSLLSGALAVGSAFVSDSIEDARTAELFRVLAIGCLCIGLASLVVMLASPDTIPLRKPSWRAIVVGLVLVLVAPGVVVGLGWFLMWVILPSAIIIPLIVGWGVSEFEAPEQLHHLRVR